MATAAGTDLPIHRLDVDAYDRMVASGLVDVPGRAVEVRTRPGPHGYEHCTIYHEGSVVPAPLDGVDNLDVAALLADVTG